MTKVSIKPKQFYINRVMHHQAADNLIRGEGWNGYKGCAIGCTLENYSHLAFEKAGIAPEWFARVEDTLFEGMTEEKSRTWPEQCLKAIPDVLHGDVKNPAWDRIKARFLIAVLKSVLDTFDHAKFPDVKNAIDMSITLWSRDDIGSEEFNRAARAASEGVSEAARAASEGVSEAARAAGAASEAAGAAWAAARAAGAASEAAGAAWAAARAASEGVSEAARAASEAAGAAWAAARAAGAAWAAEAAGAARMDYFANELLRILRETKL